MKLDFIMLVFTPLYFFFNFSIAKKLILTFLLILYVCSPQHIPYYFYL
jgi:hypothetical protein